MDARALSGIELRPRDNRSGVRICHTELPIDEELARVRSGLLFVAVLVAAAFATESGWVAGAETASRYRLTVPMVARDEPPGPMVPFAFVVGDAAAQCDLAEGRWEFSGRFYDSFDGRPYVFPDALVISRAGHAGPGITSERPDILVAEDGTFRVELPVTLPGDYTLTFESVLVPKFHYLVEVPIAGEPAFTYRYGPGCSPRQW